MHDEQELDRKWPMVPPAAVQRKVTMRATIERPSFWLSKDTLKDQHHLMRRQWKDPRLPSRTNTTSQKWHVADCPPAWLQAYQDVPKPSNGNPLMVEDWDQCQTVYMWCNREATSHDTWFGWTTPLWPPPRAPSWRCTASLESGVHPWSRHRRTQKGCCKCSCASLQTFWDASHSIWWWAR